MDKLIHHEAAGSKHEAAEIKREISLDLVYLKVHKHNFFTYYFCRNRILIYVTRDSIRLRYSTFNHFRVCSASDEIVSSYGQQAMKYIPRMLSIFWMMILKWVVISSYAEHARKLVLVGWACAKIGYSLAEHEQKLVTRCLSMRGNWLLVGWACSKIGYSQAEHTRKSFRRPTCVSKFFLSPSYHPFLCPLLPSLSNIRLRIPFPRTKVNI